MTRTSRAAAVLSLGLLSASPQGQTFRAVIQGVSVNVSVEKGKEPVAGLTEKDFELRDNGVRQQIAAVSLESVPMDMTVVLDTSESVEGEPFERLKEDMKRISANLGPADRFRFLTFGSTVAEVSPMQPRGDGVRNLSVSTGDRRRSITRSWRRCCRARRPAGRTSSSCSATGWTTSRC